MKLTQVNWLCWVHWVYRTSEHCFLCLLFWAYTESCDSGAQQHNSQSVNNLLTFNKSLIPLYLSLNEEVIAFLINCLEISCWKDKYVVIMKPFSNILKRDSNLNPNWQELFICIRLEISYFEIRRNKAYLKWYFHIKMIWNHIKRSDVQEKQYIVSG